MRKNLLTLAVCALIMAFTLPAMGQSKGGSPPPGKEKPASSGDSKPKFTLGGDVFFKTFWAGKDNRSILIPAGPLAGTWQDKGSDEDLVFERSEQPSRLNASIEYEDFTGFVEINSMNDDVNIRQAWGEYNFGLGSLAIGKMWAPTFKGTEVAIRHAGTPGMYGTAGGSDREDMIRLRFPIPVGEIQIAGVRPRYTATDSITPTATDADSDFKFPLLEASLALNFGPFSTHLSGGYLTYDEVVQVLPAPEKEYSRDAHFLQLAAAVRKGRFEIKGKIWDAENPQQYGLASGTNAPIPVAPQRLNAKYFAVTDEIADVDAIGWNIVAKYKIIPGKIAFLVGYATEYAERNDPGGLNQERRSRDMYMQLRTRLTKNIMIIPVVGMTHVEGKTEGPIIDPPGPQPPSTYKFDGDLEDTFYAGIMWRYVF